MFLSATTQSLEIDLNGAVAANQLPVVVSYVDVNQSTFAMSAMTTATTQTNSTTAVTIVAAPGATTTRQIKFLSIKNSDTSPVLLWVQLNDNATLREVTKCTLAVNDSLIYTDADGWETLDANGAAKYSQSGVAVASGKTLTVSNTLTLAGTDGTTVTFPSTSATVARTDAGQTFTGTNTFGALTLTGDVGVTGTPSFTLTGCSFTAGAGSFTTGMFSGDVSTTGTFYINTGKNRAAIKSTNTQAVANSATIVWTTPLANAGGLFIVSGKATAASNYFIDIVLGSDATDTAYAVTSQTMAGSPTARTYTWVADSLKLAMADANTYDVTVSSLAPAFPD